MAVLNLFCSSCCVRAINVGAFTKCQVCGVSQKSEDAWRDARRFHETEADVGITLQYPIFRFYEAYSD